MAVLESVGYIEDKEVVGRVEANEADDALVHFVLSLSYGSSTSRMAHSLLPVQNLLSSAMTC